MAVRLTSKRTLFPSRTNSTLLAGQGGARLQGSTWGRGELIPPSPDLLDLADELNSDPHRVLQQLKQISFRERPAVDRPFVKYLRALARFQEGDQSKTTLNLMREAYRDAQTAPLTPQERAEMARNLVLMIRDTEPDWERDPLLKDPQVQTALVEEIR